MNYLFPYDNIIIGILILIVGFIFHWVGQVIAFFDWDLAVKLGIAEKYLPKEYVVYEKAMAGADTAIGWIYGIAGVGLILGTGWGYKLAWIPGSIFIYHSVIAWLYEGNRRKAGYLFWSDSMRIGWCAANFITGSLSIWIAFNANN